MDLRLSPEETLILHCCCIEPQANRIKKIESLLSEKINWDYVFMIVNAHGVQSLLHRNIMKCKSNILIPGPILKKLEEAYHQTAYKNLLFVREYDKIAINFNNVNVKLLPLKGIAFLKQLYRNIGLRSFDDVDILVEKKDFTRAEQLLKEMGFSKRKELKRQREWHFHSLFWLKRGAFIIPVELHWDIDFVDSPFRIKVEDLWNRAELIHNDNFSSYKLSLEDSIIFNSFHVIRGDQTKILPLKNFCDLSETISKYHNEIDWQVIKERAEKYNVTRPVFLVLLLLQELFQPSIPLHLFNNSKLTGLKEKMVHILIREKIFIQRIDDMSLPSGFLGLISEKQFIEKVRITLDLFRKFFIGFRNKYYFDMNHSIRKTIINVSWIYCKSFLRYIKTILIALAYPKRVIYHRTKTTKLKKEIEEINQWIQGSS